MIEERIEKKVKWLKREIPLRRRKIGTN
jgi:hypothetical protein